MMKESYNQLLKTELNQCLTDIEAMLNAIRRSSKSLKGHGLADVVGTLHGVLDATDDVFAMIHTLNEKED